MSIRTGTVQKAEFQILFKSSLAIVLKQTLILRRAAPLPSAGSS